MTSFNERQNLTKIIEDNIDGIFEGTAVVHPFGCDSILKDCRNEVLLEYFKSPLVNQQASGMIVKFAPDFFLLKKSDPKELFFLDVKHSVSPIWYPDRLTKIREKNNDGTLSNNRIGVVAREALLAYRRFYPNTIILLGSPYNKKLLMAQYADSVRCLYCYRDPKQGEYNCENCPSNNGGFFDIERATKSDGSQTPMTNIDLDSFLPADVFFEKIGISLNRDKLNHLLELIKREPVEISDRANEYYKDSAMWNLNQSGCDWLEYKIYSIPNNSYYHISKECKIIKKHRDRIETYTSIQQAKISGKTKNCKFCFNKNLHILNEV